MPRRPLPLNALHAFLVTARHLNLTRAAQELCITQGAVSRKIAALEAWLGFSLFERHARGLYLTSRGAALLPELNQGFALIADAADKATSQSARMTLKAPTCALRWLLPKLMAFEQQHPEIEVALTTTLDHSQQLDGFDVAILYGAPLEQADVLFAETLTPVVSRSLLDGDTLSLAALSRLTFLHPTQDDIDWRLWLQAQRAEVKMARNQYFDTMDLAISAAIQGFGVTVADVTLIQADLASGRLHAPFSASVKTGAVYSVLYRRQETTANQAALIAWLQGN